MCTIVVGRGPARVPLPNAKIDAGCRARSLDGAGLGLCNDNGPESQPPSRWMVGHMGYPRFRHSIHYFLPPVMEFQAPPAAESEKGSGILQHRRSNM